MWTTRDVVFGKDTLMDRFDLASDDKPSTSNFYSSLQGCDKDLPGTAVRQGRVRSPRPTYANHHIIFNPDEEHTK